MKYKTWNLSWFNKLLRWFYGLFLRLHYRMQAVGTEILPKGKPYIIIANHVSVFDPFWISAFTGRPVYWVTSDGNMHSLLLRMLLKLVGSIPKSKAIPDLETVTMIMDVLRRRHGIAGIFAEGQATWDGTTQPLIESTAKLLMLFKGTVIGVKIKGGYASRPRWSWNDRRGVIKLEFFKLYEGLELKGKPFEDVYREISLALNHDDLAWVQERTTAFNSRHRAEHLELALFMCPVCGADTSMRSRGNRLYCTACGAEWQVSAAYTLSGKQDTIRELFAQQKSLFVSLLEERLRRYPMHKEALIADSVIVLRGPRLKPFVRIGKARAELHPDRILVRVDTASNRRYCKHSGARDGNVYDFPLTQLEGLSVLKQQYFEFYFEGAMWRFKFPERYQSGLRWLMAVEHYQRRIP